jgi:hypothetical protein
MRAVILLGDQEKINKHPHIIPIAKKFYDDIENYIRSLGVNDVVRWETVPMTMPPRNADLYVCHSRGCGRVVFMTDAERAVTVAIGDLTKLTVSHTTRGDYRCLKNLEKSNSCMPAEFDFHYKLTDSMKKSIKTIIDKKKSPKSLLSEQISSLIKEFSVV